MIKNILITFSLFFLLANTSFAATQVQATLDKNPITLEDEATLIISVSGARSSSDPVIPKVQGLDIVLTGRSSQIQIINGRMSSVAEFIFTVIADTEGTFNIPPFVVFSAGREYESNGLQLKVKKGSYYTQPQTQALPFSQRQDQQQRQLEPKETKNTPPPFWIVTNVSKLNPKIYEQILFSFKLFTRQTVDIDDLILPEFKDFRAVELIPERKGAEVMGFLSRVAWT